MSAFFALAAVVQVRRAEEGGQRHSGDARAVRSQGGAEQGFPFPETAEPSLPEHG